MELLEETKPRHTSELDEAEKKERTWETKLEALGAAARDGHVEVLWSAPATVVT